MMGAFRKKGLGIAMARGGENLQMTLGIQREKKSKIRYRKAEAESSSNITGYRNLGWHKCKEDGL